MLKHYRRAEHRGAWRRGVVGALFLTLATPTIAAQPSVQELEARVAALSRQSAQANAQLADAKARAERAESELADTRDVLGGGNGGNVELDTFRINASLDYHQWIGQLEWRQQRQCALQLRCGALEIGSNARWLSGGWYIYSDLAYSKGNLFVGNRGDDDANLYRGVGDFGVDGNNTWNYRFNLNLGYYY